MSFKKSYTRFHKIISNSCARMQHHINSRSFQKLIDENEKAIAKLGFSPFSPTYILLKTLALKIKT